MFRVRLFLLLYCLPLAGTSQTDSLQLQLLYMLPVVPDLMATDNLHHLYLITEGALNKYDINGTHCCTYSKEIGSATVLDVSNPLRPLLYYPLQGQLVLLDNTLSEIAPPLLLQQKFGQRLITLAAHSVQNSFWFYDAMNFELIRCSDQLEVIAKTGNIPQLLHLNFDPAFMLEFSNRLYVSNPATGILVFDLYGTYIKTIPVKNLTRFQVFEGLLVYSDEAELVYHNLRTHAEQRLHTRIADAVAIRQQGPFIYVERTDQIAVFKLLSAAVKP